MKKNVGSMERNIRLGAGLAAAAAVPFIQSTWARALLGVVATTGLTTGLSRYCPINEAMGIDHFSSDLKSTKEKGQSFFTQPRKTALNAYDEASDLH